MQCLLWQLKNVEDKIKARRTLRRRAAQSRAEAGQGKAGQHRRGAHIEKQAVVLCGIVHHGKPYL